MLSHSLCTYIGIFNIDAKINTSLIDYMLLVILELIIENYTGTRGILKKRMPLDWCVCV